MCGIALIVIGIITIIRGKVKLTNSREVTGAPAYLIGAILILPFPLSFAIGVVMGMQKAAEGGAVDEAFKAKATFIEFGLVIVGVILAVGIAVATSKRPEDRRRKRRLADDELDDFENERDDGFVPRPRDEEPDDRFRDRR